MDTSRAHTPRSLAISVAFATLPLLERLIVTYATVAPTLIAELIYKLLIVAYRLTVIFSARHQKELPFTTNRQVNGRCKRFDSKP